MKNKKDKTCKVIGIRIFEDEKQMLDEICEKHFISISKLFRDTIKTTYEKLCKKDS